MELDLQIIVRLRAALRVWGEDNIQAYSWRYRTDPYAIIVAEFMLHRTQALQVQRVYEQFMFLYPFLTEAIAADRKELAEILHPLGLMWRIEMMIEALHFMWDNYGGIPGDIELLLQVPGIGPYIAGATICFSANRRVPLVDTNTIRVTGRVFGFDVCGEARRRKKVIQAIEEACDPDNPRDYYYAMIDLAHAICHPNKPQCSLCPLRDVPCNYSMTLNATDK
jgi:A/G-specific adenine glycosylase